MERYFYVEGNKCHYVAGFVRKQLAQSLRRRKGHAYFLLAQWFDKVKAEAASPKCNRSVLGFLAEQAVISTLATAPLAFCGKSYKLDANVKWFEAGSEKAVLSSTEQDALFLPTVFNYPNVDMVFSTTANPKPLRVGVQVTLQNYTSHKKAASKFMNTGVCESWLSPGKVLDDYEWHFLWIMPANKIAAIAKTVDVTHASVVHKTRQRKQKVQRAAFTEHFYSFQQINPSLVMLDTL